MPNEIIGFNIRFLRKQAGLTQTEFGQKHGASQKLISAYERQGVMPNPEFLMSLSDGTGVPLDFLLSSELKTDKSGNITNLPKHDVELQQIRKDLDNAINRFQNSFIEFTNAVRSISGRVDQVERKIKKK